MSIAVPTGVNFLSLSAFTTMTGAAHTAIIAWFQVDDANCVNASGTFNNRPFDSIGGAGQSTIALNQVVAVSPGATHTVTLCNESGAAATTLTGALVAQTVAVGSTGGTTLKPADSKPVHTTHGDFL